MIELFQVDALDVQEQLVSLFMFLFDAQLDQQVADVKLLKGEQFLNRNLETSAVQTDQVVVSVLFERVLDLGNRGEGLYLLLGRRPLAVLTGCTHFIT
jgi:hypothetical protein